MISPLLLWLVVVLLEACRHVYLIKKKHISPNKVISFTVRALIAVALMVWEYFLGLRPLEVVVLAYVFAGWFLHDVILSTALYGKPWKLNNTGPIDRFQNAAGGATTWFVFKAIGCLTLVAMYFIKDNY